MITSSLGLAANHAVKSFLLGNLIVIDGKKVRHNLHAHACDTNGCNGSKRMSFDCTYFAPLFSAIVSQQESSTF